jgi:hypothetical protein
MWGGAIALVTGVIGLPLSTVVWVAAGALAVQAMLAAVQTTRRP